MHLLFDFQIWISLVQIRLLADIGVSLQSQLAIRQIALDVLHSDFVSVAAWMLVKLEAMAAAGTPEEGFVAGVVVGVASAAAAAEGLRWLIRRWLRSFLWPPLMQHAASLCRHAM
jgi:hypothetical protein